MNLTNINKNITESGFTKLPIDSDCKKKKIKARFEKSEYYIEVYKDREYYEVLVYGGFFSEDYKFNTNYAMWDTSDLNDLKQVLLLETSN